MYAPVHAGLHAGGAGGFEAADGCVEPDVAALGHASADVHVVVFEEDDAVLHVVGAYEVDDVADEGLAAAVGGVAFARDDELDGHFGVAEDREESSFVAEQEGAAFVGCESACKADGEGGGVECGSGAFDFECACAAGDELLADFASAPADEFFTAAAVDGPELGVGDFVDGLPGGGLLRVGAPLVAHVAVEEFGHVGAEPGADVYAVGYVPDGDFLFGYAWPHVLPHAP